MVYQAPILVCALVFFKIWEQFTSWIEKDGKTYVPLLLQYPLWVYLFFGYQILVAVKEAHFFVYLPSDYLSPLGTETCFNRTLHADGEGDATFLKWKEDASLEDYPLLRGASMCSIFWMVCTFLVCLYHTGKHMRMVKKSGKPFTSSILHVKTIKIVALPMVYGIMSYKSVIRAQQVVLNHIGSQSSHVFHSWEQRETFIEEMYESNFMVADIFEAYSLRMFGKLVLMVLTAKLPPVTEKQAGHRELVDAVHELTTSGINLFYYTCALDAVYWVFVTTMGFLGLCPDLFNTDPLHPGYFQRETVKTFAKAFFSGAGFIASFAAIGNVIQVEHTFTEMLNEFGPFYKFWGTKILVSIAFLQTILLSIVPPFSSWSTPRTNLLYASALCFECMLVSLLHLKAWDVEQSWYGYRLQPRDLAKPTHGKFQEPLLNVEAGEAETSETNGAGCTLL